MKKISLPLIITLFISCGKQPLFLSLGEKAKSKSTQGLEFKEATFPKTSYAYSLQWIQGPFNVGNGASKFKLRIWDKISSTPYGPFINPSEKVCAFIWMTMPDGSEHGSSPLELNMLTTDDGPIFYYTEAYFVMNGKWKLFIKLIDQNTSCIDNPSLKAKSQVIHELDIR